MYKLQLALFSSINFVPYERKFTQKESFQTTYVRRTSMQKTINCVIPKRLFGLLLNCWLETQSTLAVLMKTIIIPKLCFLQIFLVTVSPLIKSGWIVNIQIFPSWYPCSPWGYLVIQYLWGQDEGVQKCWFLSTLRVKTVQAEGDGGQKVAKLGPRSLWIILIWVKVS